MTERATVSLADISGRKGDYGLVASARAQGDHKFLRTTDMISGVIDWAAVPSSDAEPRKREKSLLKNGDIVISRTGANAGAVAYVSKPPEGAVFAGYLVRFSVDESRADPRFVYYSLRSPNWREHVESARTGSAQPQRNAVRMGSYKFWLPPLPEQRRIAGVLGALDDLIDTNEQLARSAEALARCIAERAPRSIPLGELASIDNARTVVPKGATAHYSLPAFDSSMTPELVDGATIKSIKHPIEKSMVLISRLNPHIPRIWMVYPAEGVASVSSTEFVPLVEHEDVSIESVFSVVSSPAFVAQLRSQVTGTTGSHQRVDKKALLSIDVPDVRLLPSDQEQALASLVREAHASRRAATELRHTRDELLPLLMSGKIRVREAEELVKERVG